MPQIGNKKFPYTPAGIRRFQQIKNAMRPTGNTPQGGRGPLPRPPSTKPQGGRGPLPAPPRLVKPIRPGRPGRPNRPPVIGIRPLPNKPNRRPM